MTHDEKTAFIDDLYAATGSGDWDKAASMLTEDFVVTEADGLPMAGEYRGRNALKDLYLKVFGMMDAAGFERIVTTTGGDYAVCILSILMADDSIPPAEICEVFRFRDGKVCQIKPYYYDPAPVHAACAANRRVAG